MINYPSAHLQLFYHALASVLRECDNNEESKCIAIVKECLDVGLFTEKPDDAVVLWKAIIKKLSNAPSFKLLTVYAYSELIYAYLKNNDLGSAEFQFRHKFIPLIKDENDVVCLKVFEEILLRLIENSAMCGILLHEVIDSATHLFETLTQGIRYHASSRWFQELNNKERIPVVYCAGATLAFLSSCDNEHALEFMSGVIEDLPNRDSDLQRRICSDIFHEPNVPVDIKILFLLGLIKHGFAERIIENLDEEIKSPGSNNKSDWIQLVVDTVNQKKDFFEWLKTHVGIKFSSEDTIRDKAILIEFYNSWIDSHMQSGAPGDLFNLILCGYIRSELLLTAIIRSLPYCLENPLKRFPLLIQQLSTYEKEMQQHVVKQLFGESVFKENPALMRMMFLELKAVGFRLQENDTEKLEQLWILISNDLTNVTINERLKSIQQLMEITRLFSDEYWVLEKVKLLCDMIPHPNDLLHMIAKFEYLTNLFAFNEEFQKMVLLRLTPRWTKLDSIKASLIVEKCAEIIAKSMKQINVNTAKGIALKYTELMWRITRDEQQDEIFARVFLISYLPRLPQNFSDQKLENEIMEVGITALKIIFDKGLFHPFISQVIEKIKQENDTLFFFEIMKKWLRSGNYNYHIKDIFVESLKTATPSEVISYLEIAKNRSQNDYKEMLQALMEQTQVISNPELFARLCTASTDDSILRTQLTRNVLKILGAMINQAHQSNGSEIAKIFYDLIFYSHHTQLAEADFEQALRLFLLFLQKNWEVQNRVDPYLFGKLVTLFSSPKSSQRAWPASQIAILGNFLIDWVEMLLADVIDNPRNYRYPEERNRVTNVIGQLIELRSPNAAELFMQFFFSRDPKSTGKPLTKDEILKPVFIVYLISSYCPNWHYEIVIDSVAAYLSKEDRLKYFKVLQRECESLTNLDCWGQYHDFFERLFTRTIQLKLSSHPSPEGFVIILQTLQSVNLGNINYQDELLDVISDWFDKHPNEGKALYTEIKKKKLWTQKIQRREPPHLLNKYLSKLID